MSRFLLLLIALVVPATWLAAQEDGANAQTTPWPGIKLVATARQEPRPLRIWWAEIDLDHPRLELFTTPAAEVPDSFHLPAETALDFAERTGAVLAINASPFSPLTKEKGAPVRIEGLHLTAGTVLAPAREHFAVLLFGSDRRGRIVAPPVPRAEVETAREGVGGFSQLVYEGRNVFADEDRQAPLHPRTAVGLSRDGRVMHWFVVDGRQPRSLGMTQRELAELGISRGCWSMINLDGGGSTTLVLRSPETRGCQVVNQPVGRTLPGTLRLNGNHLGLRLREQPPAPAP
ncbi:MAG TPA: phosphodiester glycosidase family protein [Gemmatales bacterium]|nr:phosphodiester glycosidase family protein [Gemmatales bacterium]HMP60394.1 phosphodiester glycosidase family protein [Gemmatales bacterium]